VQGIDLASPEFSGQIGFGVDYAVDVSRLKGGILDKEIERSIKYPDAVPGALLQTWAMSQPDSEMLPKFIRGLEACSRPAASRLIHKLLNNGNMAEIHSLTGERSRLTKRAMIDAISKSKRPLFEDVFASTLALKKPRPGVIQLLLDYGSPRDEDLHLLAQSRLDQVLERDLGL
jgi:hypothetical protein